MHFHRWKRRSFITLLCGAAAAWPLAARAQQLGKLYRIGFPTLGVGPTPATEAFQAGLRQLGYVEGHNLVILYRWASGGRKERLPDYVRELIALKADIFATTSTEAVIAIRSIDKAVPIVMIATSDPIGNGLIASFARPGGNTTGVTLFATELAGKRLELLRELVPRLERVALVAGREHPPTATLVEETRVAAKALRIELLAFVVQPAGLAEAFKMMAAQGANAVIVQQTATFQYYIGQIADLALSHRLPAIHQNRTFVEAGGLIALGPSIPALGHRAAWYADRILKGTPAADLPVEQPAKFEL